MQRPYRVVVAKPGLDGHDRGAKVIARPCATPASRSSTPACTRRPSRSSQPWSRRTPTPSGCRSSRAPTSPCSRGSLELLPSRTPATCSSSAAASSPRPTSPRSRSRAWPRSSPRAPRSTHGSSSWLEEALDGERWRRRCSRRPFTSCTVTTAHRSTTEQGGAAVDLYEYQGKQYFARFGIPISAGGVADTVDEAVAQADAAGYPVVVKAQVKVGGRGKAGGVKLAADADEVRDARRQHPRARHQGPRGQAALGRARLRHRQGVLRQLHAGPATKKHLGMLSAEGGVEIEEVAVDQPRRHRHAAHRPDRSVSTEATAREWVDRANLDPEAREQAADAPGAALPLLRRGRLRPGRDQPAHPHAGGQGARPRRQGDARRQRRRSATPSGRSTTTTPSVDDREQMAKEKGLNYIGLDGYVGIIANGAGLAMSTLDVVNQAGGDAANFLDIGGGANADVMADALEVINADPSGEGRSSSTSSAASPGGTRWPRASSTPSGGSSINVTDGHPPRRHQRRGGPGDLWTDRVRPASCSAPRMAGGAPRRAVAARRDTARQEHNVSIFVDETHQGHRPGHHRARRAVPRPAQPDVRHQDRRPASPRQGRPGRRGHPRLRHRRRSRSRRPAPTQLRHLRPAPGRRPPPSWRRPTRASRFIVCITEGIPAHDEARVVQPPRRAIPGHPAARPQLPGLISPGKCNIGITPGDIALPGGPVGIVSRSGTLTYQALYELTQQGIGPDHLCRHRRRPGPRARTSSTAWPLSRRTPRPRRS